MVLISAPDSPWAVVQLHVGLSGAPRGPEVLAQLSDFAASFAAGDAVGRREPSARRQVEDLGGATRVQVQVDGFVVSDGVPAAAWEKALGAMQHRLRHRRKLAPRLASADAHVGVLDTTPDPPHVSIALPVRKILAAGTALSYPITQSASLSANDVRHLADGLLFSSTVVLVIYAPASTETLLESANRTLRTVLSAGAAGRVESSAPLGARIVEDPVFVRSSMWFPAGGLERGAPSARLRRAASEEVLAQLLSASVIRRAGFGAWRWDVELPRGPRSAATEEARLLARLTKIAEEGIGAHELALVRRKAFSAAIASTLHPEELARILGSYALKAGDPGAWERAISLLGEIDAGEIREAARLLLRGARVTLRSATSEGLPP